MNERYAKYLTAAEASAYLRERWGIRIQPSGLARKRTAGNGPRYVRSGVTPLYAPSALDDFAGSLAEHPNTAKEGYGS